MFLPYSVLIYFVLFVFSNVVFLLKNGQSKGVYGWGDNVTSIVAAFLIYAIYKHW